MNNFKSIIKYILILSISLIVLAVIIFYFVWKKRKPKILKSSVIEQK
jgi:hypothetical protein